MQFLLLQRYALFSDIPSIEPVKLRAVKINTPLLMQSDISFILDLYLPIVACTCDVSTLAKYHRIADRIPVLVWKEIVTPPQRGKAEDQIQSAWVSF